MLPSIEYITLSFLDSSLDHLPDNSYFNASGLANPEKGLSSILCKIRVSLFLEAFE